MEGLERVFAGEFCRCTCSTRDEREPGSSVLLTPGGAWCRRVFLAGALTEATERGGVVRCRLADPTGAFDLEVGDTGRSGHGGSVLDITVPSFLAVTGMAQLANRGGPFPFIRPDSFRVIDRAVRDAWVLRTADSTLQRIAILAAAISGGVADERTRAVIGHYHTTESSLLDLTGLVESALEGIRQAPPAPAGPAPDTRETVLAIIRDRQGPRGIPVDDVVAAAALFGITAEKAKEAVAELIRDDELYQPQKGSVRLL
jgi:RPA family protein